MTCENVCQGYNTWNDFECRGEMSAQGIVAVADSLLDSGLFAAGYLFLNLNAARRLPCAARSRESLRHRRQLGRGEMYTNRCY